LRTLANTTLRTKRKAAAYKTLISTFLSASLKDVIVDEWKAEPASTKIEAHGIIHTTVAKKNHLKLILRNPET
jgi:hypothetical protein